MISGAGKVEAVEKLKNLMRSYRNRQCVLFVGAGFSSAATSLDLDGNEIDVPSGRKLSEYFKDHLVEDSDDLSSLADIYEDEYGEHGLYKLLKAFYVVNGVTPSQESVCRFGWKEIYTTNYDNVVETCLAKAGKQHAVYSPLKKPSDVDYRTLPIIHINGYIQTSSFNEFKREIKLTDSQYFSDDFSRSAWGERFRNDIITSPCVIFAGYSLYDLDVARVLNTFEGMKERIFFIVKDKPSRSLEKKLQQFGTVLQIGTDGLAKIVDDINLDNTSPKIEYLSAWEKISLPSISARSLRDIDVVNFMMSGSIDYDLFSSDTIQRSFSYTINREDSDYIVNNISSFKLSNVLVYSNAGNGKTTFLDSVGYKLAARNFHVYRATSNSSLLLKEIPIIRNISGSLVLLIDDAFSHLDAIRAIIALGRSDIYIIATARTSQTELQEGEIRRVFNDNVELFSLDRLKDSEIAACITFLDKYALWGSRQALSFEQKTRFIEKDCSRELRFVILEALDSPIIKSRIQAILNFQGAPDVRDKVRTVLIISQLLNLAQVRSDLSVISELVQFDARKAIAEHATKLRDFSLIRNGQISIRSSVFSDYVIKKLIETAFVIEVMTKAMRHLDVVHENDQQYAYIYKNFSRFRFVESAISSEKRLVHMVKYFEDIKDLSHSRAHPLFWLQYAMCRISLNQFKEAERLFDVAYAFSKQSGFKENRHLNNQFARFLLESRTKSNEYTDYMVAFNKAHSICVKQMIDEPLSNNPYRVAQNYLPFLERRSGDLEIGDLVAIIRSCSEILKQYRSRPGDFSQNSIVEHCAVAMKKTSEAATNFLSARGVKL